uniref:Uncharacterized protein n=1 Tax=Plectus sambesii TaxID=2011161 RepID=A0A914VVF0_9BILA
MNSGLIAIFCVFALAWAAHLPDCTGPTRFPPKDCSGAYINLNAAAQFQTLGPSGKYWLLALWTNECMTQADKETCVACNTVDVNTAWASTNATITCVQLWQNAASIAGVPVANCSRSCT